MRDAVSQTGPTLFDALAEADEAIARVEQHADEDWMMFARAALWKRAQSQTDFTTDDIMEDISLHNVTTHDARALGPVVRRALRSGTISEVGMTRSRRRHGARIPVYRGKPTTNEARK